MALSIQITNPTTAPYVSTNSDSIFISGTNSTGIDYLIISFTNANQTSYSVLGADIISSPTVAVNFYDGTGTAAANNVLNFVVNNVKLQVIFVASATGVSTTPASIVTQINSNARNVENPTPAAAPGSYAQLSPDGNGIILSSFYPILIKQTGYAYPSYPSLQASANTILGLANNSSTSWSFAISSNLDISNSPTLLSSGENTFIATAQQGATSASDTLIIIYDPNLQSDYLTLLPTGVQLLQQRGTIKLIVPEFYLTSDQIIQQGLSTADQQLYLDQFNNFIGFNFYGSEFVGGGSDGYTLLNEAPINVSDPTQQQQITYNTTTSQSTSNTFTGEGGSALGAAVITSVTFFNGTGSSPANNVLQFTANGIPTTVTFVASGSGVVTTLASILGQIGPTASAVGSQLSLSASQTLVLGNGSANSVLGFVNGQTGTPPASLGNNGDTFINQVSNVYYLKQGGNWILQGAASDVLDSAGIKQVQVVTTTTTQSTYVVNYYSYIHDRTGAGSNPLAPVSKPITENNYYVITAKFFDPSTNTVIESRYSAELAGKPFTINTQLQDIPQRTVSDFRLGIFDQLLQTNDSIDVKPGTVLRDTIIDPESTLLATTYSILSFISAAQSFATLIAFDDPNGTGTSAPVLTTPAKNNLRIALLISENDSASVQKLIDTAFDKLASNLNTTRNLSTQATGLITVYTNSVPTRNASVLAGAICQTLPDTVTNTPSIRFVVLAGFTLPLSNLAAYYNSVTQRYEFQLNVQAELAGSSGNVNPGQIVSIVSGFDNLFSVVNENATSFGTDRESNQSLANRAELAFLSVDSGTQYGYYSNAIKNIGVESAIVVKAGDALMQRDLDPLRLVHVYGKVDIYILGEQDKTVTDSFAFMWDKVVGERFFIQANNPVNLEFRSNNPNVTDTSPIFLVYQIENISQNRVYPLTPSAGFPLGYKIVNDGNVIQLDATVPGNTVNNLDVISITYLYRASGDVVLQTQPVEIIQTVTGTVSGILSTDNYELVRKDDPLLLGRSARASDSIRFVYTPITDLPVTDTGVVNPRVPRTQTNEAVVMNSQTPALLQNIGVYQDTIAVYSDIAHTVQYVLNQDYVIIPGTNPSTSVVDILRYAPSIQMVSTGNIPSGNTVFVDYQYGETMNVNYTINSVLSNVNTVIQEMKHLCADVVVKSAQATNIQIMLNVILNAGADYIQIDQNIRSNIRTFLSQNPLGVSVYQSEIISLAESVPGVSHINVPIVQMVKIDGTQVIREELTDPQFTVYQSGIVNSFKSTEKLSSKTIVSGGGPTDFVQVYENDVPLKMVATDTAVNTAKGQAFVTVDTAGNGFLIVSPTNSSIDLSTTSSVPTYTVTYAVYGEGQQAKDIILTSIEYPTIAAGDLIITYTYLGSAGAVTTAGL